MRIAAAAVLLAGCGRVAFEARPDAGDAATCTPIETRVSNDPAESQGPNLAWVGDRFVTCWEDYRFGTPPHMFCRFVGADGTPTTGELDIVGHVSEVPDVMWNGSAVIGSWTDARDGDYDIYLAPFDENGARLAPDLEESTTIGVAWRPDVIATSSELAFVWYDDRDGNMGSEIYFARAAHDASAMIREVRVSNAIGESYDPKIANVGDGYGIVWWDNRNGPWDAFYTRLDYTGAAISGDRLIETETDDATNPRSAWSGSELGVVYVVGPAVTGPHAVKFETVDGDGTVLAPPVQVSQGQDSDGASIAWTEDGFAIAWTEGGEVWLTRPGETPRQITSGALASGPPSLVTNGRDFGVAWQDARFGAHEIMLATVCH